MKEIKLIPSNNLFPVVGIGASAGGLDAFKKLIKSIPEDSGIAYVLVQHLDPSHESILPELLQKVTQIPVLEITDEIRVEPNHIYVIPSNKMMVASDGVLKLTPRPEKSVAKLNLSIDLFFKSLAEIHQAYAIGVVLSGTASDGTKGLKAIKDNGGITFAQDESSAAYEGMPHSAAQAGVVDFILPPEQIPLKIIEVANNLFGNNTVDHNVSLHDEDVYKQIISLLRIRKGTDFTYYKQTTIRRRIIRRMVLNKNKNASSYLNFLRENKTEQDLLYQDLLIPVTTFFRDIKSFENLCETVFPQILKNKAPGEPIRAWVAGCSTGEEAYSLAICFKEYLGDNQRVQIFATDISEPAIAKARIGIYSKSEVESISPHRLSEFFTKTNVGYHVIKQVRDMCVFANHNFLKDPPFGKLDLITCRNVLIYMEPYLQKKALTTFHYSLNQKGFLLLGKSETTSGVPDLYISVAKNDKLFSRKDTPNKFIQDSSHKIVHNINSEIINIKTENIRTDFQKSADEILLSKYTPAGVVVNESMDIVHFRGGTGNYLEQSPGKPTHNLLQMAKHGLSFELRNIIHKVKKEKKTILKENVPLQLNGSIHSISIEAIPLPNSIEPYFLILFHDIVKLNILEKLGKDKKSVNSKNSKDEKDLRIQQLEQELDQAREDMRSITEEQEAANEELQSANEELLSSSEELQSLNEELETNKEELQSTNEELTVVNHEIITLNGIVTEERDYSEAIVATVQTPLIVLNKNLQIKSANRAFYKTFQVNEGETEGKLIYDIGNKQWDIPALRILLEQILPEQSKILNYEVTQTFQILGERKMLLNAQEIRHVENANKLILLGIEDITEKRRSEELFKKNNEHFRNLVKNLPAAVYSCNMEGRITFYNNAAEKLWGQKPNIENDLWSGTNKIYNSNGTLISRDQVPMALSIKNDISVKNQEIIYERPDGSRVNVLSNPQPEFNLLGERIGSINILLDITDQITAHKKAIAQASMIENLLMTAPGFVCTLKGPNHVYDLINAKYQEMFGKRILKGKPILEALPELIDQEISSIIDKVYNTGVPFVGIETAINIARDENLTPELGYFNFSYQPIYDENNNIHSILVFGYEVTEQVNAKNKTIQDQKNLSLLLEEKILLRTQELLEANLLLFQKNQELESFTFVSSHDMQEPLRKIQTFSTRILEKEIDNLSESGKDYFHRLQSAAARMQKLIDDLLTFSRLDSSERKFVKSDLKLIINDVINEHQDTIREKKAIIEIMEVCEVNIIQFQFRQLINNLLANSLKFSIPEIPPHIIINCSSIIGNKLINTKLIPELNYFHLSFKDNGIGFEQHFGERIFEVFQKLHQREEYAGTGIGLAIVKKIVETHNGIISVKSELGKGTTFDIYIPANQ